MNRPVIYPGYPRVNRRIWHKMVILRIDVILQQYGYSPMWSMTMRQFDLANSHIREDIRVWTDDNIGPQTTDNRNGAWKLSPPCYYFKNERDATLFKLRWC